MMFGLFKKRAKPEAARPAPWDWKADREAALVQGEHCSDDLSNCGYGSRGYTLHTLVKDGLMKVDSRQGERGIRLHDYRLTDAGRAAQIMLTD